MNEKKAAAELAQELLSIKGTAMASDAAALRAHLRSLKLRLGDSTSSPRFAAGGAAS